MSDEKYLMSKFSFEVWNSKSEIDKINGRLVYNFKFKRCFQTFLNYVFLNIIIACIVIV